MNNEMIKYERKKEEGKRRKERREQQMPLPDDNYL